MKAHAMVTFLLILEMIDCTVACCVYCRGSVYIVIWAYCFGNLCVSLCFNGETTTTTVYFESVCKSVSGDWNLQQLLGKLISNELNNT